MPWAEFAEREYELAANIELAVQGAVFHTPAQVLEKFLGYDVAVNPRDPSIWTLLQEAAPPGALLMPNLWLGAPVGAGDLPSFHVSLLIQYKRPQQMVQSNAGQWSYWRRPYYRIWIEHWQRSNMVDRRFRSPNDFVGTEKGRTHFPDDHNSSQEVLVHVWRRFPAPYLLTR